MEWSAGKITYIRTVQIYLATKLFSYIFVKIFYIFQKSHLKKEKYYAKKTILLKDLKFYWT